MTFPKNRFFNDANRDAELLIGVWFEKNLNDNEHILIKNMYMVT